ncbi:hypothetical protein KW797_04690, partial [Candidatus Parcubacteria bacterium]|nr:hypothetical protein [Candidatus Parcubacteria bacterium]
MKPIAFLAVLIAILFAVGALGGHPPQKFDSTVTVTGRVFTFGYPSDFGLAAAPEQALIRSYIPPCDEKFDYCLYYNGKEYEGTNFESAGLRIKRRADLAGAQCLTAAPGGREGLSPASVKEESAYSKSVFSPLGEGAAGHTAEGALYRLSYAGECYEFEMRIGKSQFANYPAGTIKHLL